jgi:DNA mismatch endonuclease (patch repair protein)
VDRSANMRAIRSKDTKPERMVRSMLHKLGYRFRLHRRNLPGQPDIVFASRKKVIFVNGCFWHMHDCRKGQRAPITNAEFWDNKRRRTAERDNRTHQALAAAGWESYVVWECGLGDLAVLQRGLEAFLSQTNPRSGERRSAAC